MLDDNKKTENSGCRIFFIGLVVVAILWGVTSLIFAFIQATGMPTTTISGFGATIDATTRVPFLSAFVQSSFVFGIFCFPGYFLMAIAIRIISNMKRSDSNL